MELMQHIPDASINMIMTDLPYGTTYAKWDHVLPMPALWDEYRRIITENGAIVLTASQPFTSLLVTSALAMFRCEWIWDKVNAANFANANRQPLKVHESVLVFSKSPTIYNPIKTSGKPNHVQGKSKLNQSDTRLIKDRVADDLSGMKFPKSILTIPKHSSQCGLHPTQKPVELGEYFINTYSNPGDLILDNCVGSGSFGVAAINTGRNFIGIEMDEKYHAIATKRLNLLVSAY